MEIEEAVAICEEWLAFLERQRQKSVEMQKLAVLARTQPDEARRRMCALDRSITTYDGSRLESAVRALVQRAQARAN